jgi:hypothetical protein
MWGAIFGYAFVVMILFAPFLKNIAGHDQEMTITALICTLPMLAYIMMGLMGYGAYLGWLGAGVMALTIVGYQFASSWFYLWMAIFGAGALLAAGFIIRWRLRKNENAQ